MSISPVENKEEKGNDLVDSTEPSTSPSSTTSFYLKNVIFKEEDKKRAREKITIDDSNMKIQCQRMRCLTVLVKHAYEQGYKRGTINRYKIKKIRGATSCVGIVGDKLVGERNSKPFQFSCYFPSYRLHAHGYRGGSIKWCDEHDDWTSKDETHALRVKKWGNEGTVEMVVDMINWNISFYLNNELLGEAVPMKQRDVYYAAVGFSGSAEFEIINCLRE